MNKDSNHDMGPLKRMFGLQMDYGLSYNSVESRDVFQGLNNGIKRGIRTLGPILSVYGPRTMNKVSNHKTCSRNVFLMVLVMIKGGK